MNSLICCISTLTHWRLLYLSVKKIINMSYKHSHAVPVQNWVNKLGTMQENYPTLRKSSNIHELHFLLKPFPKHNRSFSSVLIRYTVHTNVIKRIIVGSIKLLCTMQTFREQHCRMQLTVQCEQSLMSVSWERSEIWTESGASVNRFHS